ncbi:MAG: hypothetical protein NZ898_02095 [Myxococcota bacterium]|nr:hypothetical protein [Myxococcota bacterium]MDW8361601.1 hypothetical protein [Myxococcales bacterium]
MTRTVLVRRFLVITALSTALAGLVTWRVRAVPVRGTLEWPRNHEPAAARPSSGPAPFYWEERNGILDVRPRRIDAARDFAVGLFGSGPGPAETEVALDGGDFSPTTVLVRAGTTLRIVNRDACSHELYVEGREDFTPLGTSPGNARTTQVREAGTFEIRDRLYAHVRGWVVAAADLVARGTVESSGAFAFADVPAGSYTLRVYYRGREVARRDVTVTDAGPVTVEPAVAVTLAGPGDSGP